MTRRRPTPTARGTTRLMTASRLASPRSNGSTSWSCWMTLRFGFSSSSPDSSAPEPFALTASSVSSVRRLFGGLFRFFPGVFAHDLLLQTLINQFAECLEKEIMGENTREEPEQPAEQAEGTEETEEAVSANGSGAEETGEEEEKPKRRIIEQDHDVEPLDLGEASRDAVIKRVVPLAAGVGALVVILWLLRRRRSH